MSKPIAVLISDVHYNINTLEIADKAMRLAVDKANELNVLLIVAGDLHDTKANLRGECVNAMIETFKLCDYCPAILVGNHDKINEKSEEHSLNFLRGSAAIIDTPTNLPRIGTLFPYYSDVEELREELKQEPKGNLIIMHQGLTNSNAGHYIQDKSAINKEDVAGLRVISGHYHTRQTILLPDEGSWDYLGNPYTLGFGESNDPEKGFHVLYDDCSLEFIPTKLRKHVIVNMTTYISIMEPAERQMLSCDTIVSDSDIVWVKLSGTKEDLTNITKQKIAKLLGITDFKLDFIPSETKGDIDIRSTSSQPELLDNLISTLTNTSEEQKTRIKTIWKSLT